jgi:hypothetical protein
MNCIKGFGRGWAYIGLTVGGSVSVAANVAHSYVPPIHAGWSPPAGSVIGAVFWPVALFVAVEILARINWPQGHRWVVLRYAGLLPVALVAAVVSYRHLSGLLSYYREDTLTAVVGPLAVDGLMVMATGALIATSRHIALPKPVTVQDSLAHQPVSTADTNVAVLSALAAGKDTVLSGRPKRVRSSMSGSGTATAVTRLRDQHPGLTQSQIAQRLGISDRTVRRYLTATTT